MALEIECFSPSGFSAYRGSLPVDEVYNSLVLKTAHHADCGWTGTSTVFIKNRYVRKV